MEGGGLGRSPPRYNCTACPLVSLKCDLNVQCLLTSLRLANLLTYFTAFASYAQGRFSNRSGVYFDGCHLCANGTFSNDRNGATVCTPCPRGSYQRSSGSTSCEGCPAGRFMNTTGDGFACDACPRGRSTNGETGYAVCSRCSELNSPAEEGFDSVTKCFNRMQCGKVGGDYYYQDQKGAETCQKCKNSGRRGSYGCDEFTGEFQCYAVRLRPYRPNP